MIAVTVSVRMKVTTNVITTAAPVDIPELSSVSDTSLPTNYTEVRKV